MGFLRRSVELENYFDDLGVDWVCLSDAEYKDVLSSFNEFIAAENYLSLTKDKAFQALEAKLPLNGFVFSAPGHKLFSIYPDAKGLPSIGYKIVNLNKLERAKLNNLECVVANTAVTFACACNHEWDAFCPELYIERNI